MPEPETTSSGLASLVPQLFFDIIARLVPGSFLIGAFVLAGIGPEATWSYVRNWLKKPAEAYPSIIISVGAIFVVSYTLSIVLLGVREAWEKFREKKPQNDKNNSNSTDDFSLKYDYIKRKDKDAGGRIAKLNAEIHMASNLTLGFILCLLVFVLCFAVNAYRRIDSLSLSQVILAVSLLMAILGSIFARRHFRSRLERAVDNNAKILGYKKWKEEEDASSEAEVKNVEAEDLSKEIASTDKGSANQIASVSDTESVE